MTPDHAALTEAFEARSLDNAAFGHLDHVAVAYEMLHRYDFIEATARYADNIRALAAKAGAPDKFNTTITFAFMGLIAERMASGDYADYEAFITCNADLKSKGVLEKWYSPERLNSAEARRMFLLPDAD